MPSDQTALIFLKRCGIDKAQFVEKRREEASGEKLSQSPRG